MNRRKFIGNLGLSVLGLLTLKKGLRSDIESIKKKYDCPDKPYTEHPNYIRTNPVFGREYWRGKNGELEFILTTRGEMWARSFRAGHYEGRRMGSKGLYAHSAPFRSPLGYTSKGRDLRHIL